MEFTNTELSPPFFSDLNLYQKDWGQEWVDAIYKGSPINPKRMVRTPPPKLYYYTSLDQGSRYISAKANTKKKHKKVIRTLSGFLNFSDPTYFNDPFDCLISKQAIFQHVYSNRPYNQLEAEAFEEDYKKNIVDSRKNIFVRSLTEVNDSILMWSHYAKNHTGICVELDIDQYINNLKNGTVFRLIPVIYTNETKKFYDHIFSKKNKGTGKTYDTKNGKYNEEETEIHLSDNVYRLSVMIKSKDWDYEKEWRFYDRKNNIKTNRTFKCPVSKVFLGVSINKKNKFLVTKIAQSKGIPVYQYKISNDRFGLESYRIDPI